MTLGQMELVTFNYTNYYFCVCCCCNFFLGFKIRFFPPCFNDFITTILASSYGPLLKLLIFRSIAKPGWQCTSVIRVLGRQGEGDRPCLERERNESETFKIILITRFFYSVCVHVCTHLPWPAYMWRSELSESVLSLHCVGLRLKFRLSGLVGSKRLYLLSHRTGPRASILNYYHRTLFCALSILMTFEDY